MFIKVDKFIYPIDFIGLDMDIDNEVLLILGQLFSATMKVLIDVEAGRLTL